jgi:ADP-ribosylglycohydrolase
MLYGVLYGDIAGSTYEFRSVTNYNFTTVPPESRFTDDTVMTCAVASWLMQDRKDTQLLVSEMQRLGNMYSRAGYGGMFRKWLKSDNPQPYNSFGNGSAMRVAPCAWVAKSLEEAEELAGISASVTHNHPEGIKGAQAVAAAIFMARMGKSKEDIQEYIETKYGYDLNRTVDDIVEDDYSFDSTCQGSVP